MTALAIINKKQGLHLAGGNKTLAGELLGTFMAQLPQALACICPPKDRGELEALRKHVHKQLGIACYCGIPRLQQALKALEKSLESKEMAKIKTTISAVLAEGDELLAEFSRMGYQ